MDPCLRKNLRQTIAVATVTAYAPGGAETLSTPVTYNAHVEFIADRRTAQFGTEKDGDHLIILEEEITLDDRVWLPGLNTADESCSRRPEQVIAIPDPRTGEISHYEVTL